MERGSKRKRLRAPSPAMVVACIALTVTLSGVSYAATLAANSVGTKQLKNNAVNGAKVANDSLTGADIAESTLAGVNAATLDGLNASDFELAGSGGGSDAYVAGGGNWTDRDGTSRNHILLTDTGAVTQWCTLPGASVTNEPGVYQDIHLPQGATVTKMTADYRDDPGTTLANGTITLMRTPMYNSTGSINTIFSVTLGNLGAGLPLTATDNTPGDTFPFLGIIDNTKYAYTLLGFPAQPLTGVGFCNVKIDYDLP